ncbi:hypothetical protein N7462_002049 [Penicillium macrosclerotiorum]|uniref:uncharacterized protein n=1 Tax=Penicillium macrosclerotiorum TaxID=303699 RepID=UPI002547AFF1|nr:uncharacterized protein N7462_002049 [Penicillium macrosclerotiorum]KAJ5692626.1 hypothetical protein N7462_002049 [Penicillium macrosclerotiorum]
MISSKNTTKHRVDDPEPSQMSHDRIPEEPDSPAHNFWSRQTYFGSLVFNLGTFFLPALYSTLSKLWVADIDSGQVATTDVYTYIGVIVEVLNDSFPRSAWLLIGDKATRLYQHRLNLAHMIIGLTMALGFIMMIIFLAYPQSLASAFVPEDVRKSSLTYVRLSSVQFFTSATEAALSSTTRALDNPDVPLIINSSKFAVNILLDFLIISKYHVGSSKPTVITQAIIRLVCDTISALAGLIYFELVVVRRQRKETDREQRFQLSTFDFMTILRPSVYTLTESAIRNAIYLWLVNRIIQLGQDYATAWGVFNTIRWGLVMVPVQALQASTLAFVGHNWGQFRASQETDFPKASHREISEIIRPAALSCIIALIFEVIICIALSIRGIGEFAYYLSDSRQIAEITQRMWKVIDWTYVFYGLNYQLTAVLLAASPRWFLYQALGSNLLWMLPWAIVMTEASLPASMSWTYYAIIFGGAMVFDFFDAGLTLLLWINRLQRGKINIGFVNRQS